MAEFGIKATDLQDPQAVGSAPIRPVQGPADVVPDLQGLGGLMTGLFDKKSQPWDKVLSDYAYRVSDVQQAQLTGSMTQGAAANRIAMLTVQYQKDGAGYGPQFTKALSEMRTHLGIGTRINTNEEMQQKDVDFRQGQVQDLIKNGLLQGNTDYASLSPQDQRNIDDFGAALRYARQLQDTADANFERQAKIAREGREAGKYEREGNDYILKKQAQDALGGMMSSSIGIVDTQLSQIMSAQGMTDQQKQQNYELGMGRMKAQAWEMLKDSPDTYNTYVQHLDSISKLGRELLDPTKKTAALEDEYKRLITQAKIAFVTANPANLRAAGVSAVFPTTPATSLGAGVAAMNYMQQDLMSLGKPLPSVVTGNTQGQQVTFKATTDTINRAMTGKESNPQKALTDAAQVAASTVKAVGTFQAGSQNSMAQAVDFLASPEYGHLVKQKMFDQNDSNIALGRFSDLYLPAVATEIRKVASAPVGDTRYEGGKPAVGNANLYNLIDFTVDDAGKITVVKKIDPEYRKGITASDVYIDRMVREANSALGKELTNTLRAGAHLEGRTDYKKYYEETAPALLRGFLAPQGQALEKYKANGYLGTGNLNNPANWRGGKIPDKLEDSNAN